MKALHDPTHLLASGLALVRDELQLPARFPPEVIAAAEAAVQRAPTEHIDRTSRAFVSLDPAGSTDLDQAFAFETSGRGRWLLHYAIADVGWFVAPGSPLDAEAWRRGTSQYLPDGKVPLYPPILSEQAASLLPNGDRPAIIFTVRLNNAGDASLEGVERALIRSRAKLGYETVDAADLPAGFAPFARKVQAAEAARGAARVDPPEQEVTAGANGGFALRYQPRVPAEDQNAALSLATNLAVAQLMLAHNTGLYRVMAGPDERAIARLRMTAQAYGLDWPTQATLAQFRCRLDPAEPRAAAFMLAVRRAGRGASYEGWQEGVTPWHAAVAAPYAHATAPLRRLADRHIVETALALANGRSVPESAVQAFARLPQVMAKADQLGGRIERAVVDLAEAVMLGGRIGEPFQAIVTDIDERGARIQLVDLPVVARIDSEDRSPGERLTVKLIEADPTTRTIRFSA
jgi:exoribonuclease R